LNVCLDFYEYTLWFVSLSAVQDGFSFWMTLVLHGNIDQTLVNLITRSADLWNRWI